jgi:ribosomal protein L7/L12
MPGAAVTGGAGAAAGAGAAVVVGANAGLGAIKSYKSSTSQLGDKTAKEVVDQLNGYFSQQGRTQNPAGA